MQKTIKSLMFVAAAAMGIVSCQSEVSTNIDSNLVVKASVQDLDNAEEAKTYIGEAGGHANSIIWGTDEFLKIAVVNGSNSVFATSTDDSKDLFNGETEALFAFDMSVGFEAPYTYCGIYPASVAVSNSNTNPAAYKIDLPAVQKATAASYDPAAYVMVVKPQSFEAVQTDLSASFRRATALNCITLKNLNDDITSVEITATGKDLVGRRYFNLTTGESGDVYSNQSDKIGVNYETALAKAAEKKVWFTSWGVEIASGETLTVKASSATASYTRTITANASGIKFSEGCLNTLDIDMTSAEVEEIKDYSGEYLIVSGNYLMTTHNEGDFFNLEQAAGAELSDFYAIPDIENYVWTVAKLTDGNYSIFNATTSKYFALTKDDNKAHIADALDDNAKMSIKDVDDVLNIYSVTYATRRLRCNSGSSRFAFYSSTTGSVATLLAYVADERTPFDPVSGLTWDSTGKTVSWTAAEGATNGYEYTLDNGTTVKAASTNSIDCSSWTNGDYSVKVRVVATDTKKTSEWSSACEFTISGGAAADVYTFDLSSNPGGWPTANSTTLTNYTYRLGSTDYTFALNNVKCNSGYLMLTKPAVLGLPAIEGKKLTKIVATNSSGCSTSTKVGVSADSSTDPISYISGGDAQTWSVKSSSYTYELEDTEDNTVYYLIATAANAQIITLELTYEATVALSSVTVSGTPTKTAYKAGDEFETTGLIAKATFEDTSVKDVTDDVEWTVTPSPLTTGTTSVSVKASYKGVTSSAYVVNGLTVTEPATLSSIAVKTAPTKVVYNEGEKFDPAGLVITRNYSDSSSDDYAYSGHESEFTFSPATSTALTTSNTSVTITYGGKSVNQTITVNEKVIPTFSSLEDLAAAVLTSGTEVKVSFENVPIKSIYVTSKGYRNGIYFNIQKGGKDIEIYYQDVPETWVAGGTVSGTMTCPWKEFNGTWELAPDQGTWDWNNLSYTAPIAPCETPVISISESGSATISCATTGASIYYTVGTSPADPTNASTLYTGAVAMTDGQTIKAIAYKDGMNPSEVASNKYTAGGGTDPKEYTYTFNSKSWGDATSSWTSGKDGNGYTANQGVQITSGATGANATSKSSFTNISKIVVNYCTNTSKGKGTISVKVGSGTAKSYSVSAPSSGGTTLRNTDDFVFSTPESGTVNITVTCGTNSIYINSITITAE